MDKKKAIFFLEEKGSTFWKMEKFLGVAINKEAIIEAIQSTELYNEEKIALAYKYWLWRNARLDIWKALIINLINPTEEEFVGVTTWLAKKMKAEQFIEVVAHYLEHQTKTRDKLELKTTTIINKFIELFPHKKNDFLRLKISYYQSRGLRLGNVELLKIGFTNPLSSKLWHTILENLSIEELTAKEISGLLSQNSLYLADKLFLLRLSVLNKDQVVQEIYKLPRYKNVSSKEIRMMSEILNKNKLDAVAINKKRQSKLIQLAIANTN